MNMTDYLILYTVASSAQEAASWEGVELPELSTLYSDENGVFIPSEEEAYKAHVQASLEFLDANLFAYFKPNSKVATLMPHKVLISESIFSNGNIPGWQSAYRIRREIQFFKSIWTKSRI